MNKLQKWGGVAALYEALAYIIGFVGFIAVVNVGGITDPLEKVAAIVENQGLLTALHLIVYVAWGASLVVLSLALHDRLDGKRSALARTATAFGIIWSVLVIASGMIYNVGMETAVSLHAANPEQAATVWLAIESVFNGLGGGVEVVGGIWVLLLSAAALGNGSLSRAFNYFGFLVGVAGIVSVVPALAEISASLFGLTQIVWFAWLGMALLRQPKTAVQSATAPA
ncbi:MAG: DUF4386 family protein [Ardenticatenaceae bacterium]|nr:DUF4386 family protein [Ardenticatenaceae bacterium]